ncbi:AsmA family protein [Lacinutrix undariae]
MKKALKIAGITLLIIFLLLLAIPYAFQSQIKTMVKDTINDNLNAKVEFSDVSLSLIKSFPKAHVEVNDLLITNFAPFKDETFASVKDIAFTMSVMELFKTSGEAPIIINSISVDEALITLKTNALGAVNYDITKESDTKTTPTKSTVTESSSFAFDIENYSISNSALTYIDESSKINMHLTEINHTGKGIFSADASELDTNTTLNISANSDGTNYLNNHHIELDAIIGMDLNAQKYTFKDNKALINKLPLKFKGFVQLLENGQDIDITFENPGSTFKDFLAIIPESYSKDIADVKTTGGFKFSGIVKGLYSETTIPTLDINIVSENASFKYPDLPKAVENININTTIKNTTGNIDDTYVAINTLDFKIDEDIFKSSATIKNMTKNMLVNASIDGILNLANITKAYPVELDDELTGILKAKLNTSFDMNAIETNAFQRIKNNGTVSLSGFKFSSEDMLNPLQISKADMSFKPGTISLNNFTAQTGQSDIEANGTIKNLLGFLLNDATLQGNFNLNSNNFVINDFMVSDTNEAPAETSTENKSTTTTPALKIPAFLDCTINANAKNVVYDNLNLKNVKGSLLIKDQKATLSNMTTNIFDGILSLNGTVSTQTDTPTFNMNLGINSFDIAQSFKDLELLQTLAPVAKALQGKLNSTLTLSGALDSEFSPVLNTMSGDAFAELLTTEMNPQEGQLLSKLDGALDFIDFTKLNLKDLKANLTFKDGKVTVKPFHVKYEDIDIEVSGSHSFDQALSYNAIFNVPAKYLGSDVNKLIAEIDDSDVKNLTVPVTANITGNYTNPKVSTDLTSGVTNLTKQLVEIEKQKLINKGTDQVKDLLSGLLGDSKNTTSATDSTTTSATEKETTTTKEETKDVVKNILGGLLSKNKEKDTVN